MRVRSLLLPLVACHALACSGADDPTRATSGLECVPSPGQDAVPWTLDLTQSATFAITLVSRDCQAAETRVTLTSPASVAGVVVDNACSATPGTVWAFDDDGAPFPAGTEIDMEFTSDQFANPPAIRVNGTYPQWTINFEDGFDQDFNDVVLQVTAVPAS